MFSEVGESNFERRLQTRMQKNCSSIRIFAIPKKFENGCMLFAVLLGFLHALILIPAGKLLKGKAAVLNALVPIGLFAWFCSHIPALVKGEVIRAHHPWIPSFGVSMDFTLDGLSLIFVLLITGIGSMVFLYTSAYLKGHGHLDRFYGYLTMFMASMLGLVLADNLITILVFWELTSITSFFLIGFKNYDEGSRKAALTSMGITGFGGVLFLAGAILIGWVGGSTSLGALLSSGTVFSESPYYALILFFIFGAAFTKSAQFPFHFWLPGAMKAPTPVSTYLHSATMVKAGIYLLLRLSPILGDTPLWQNTLLIFGGVTMFFGAFHTLFRTDLKGILAYSTISALGILVFLIGIGTEAAILAALFFILVHAIYKATLFLVAGGIDLATGTRDVTALSGLRRWLLPLTIAGFLGALVSAGIPPTIGFLGKDLIYEATLNAPLAQTLLTILAISTNILLLYAGFVTGLKPFFGKPMKGEKEIVKSPLLIWLPAVIVGLSGIVFGIFPGLGEALAIPAVNAIAGPGFAAHISLWHGFTLILLLSGITIGTGFCVYFLLHPTKQKELAIARIDFIAPKRLTELFVHGFHMISGLWTRLFNSGYLRYYFIVVLVFIISVLGYKLFEKPVIYMDLSQLKEVSMFEMGTILIMILSIFISVFSASRLTAIASMGVLGYAICIIFVFYGAPDLAMTQFAIDTLTVILFVLVLYRLPKYLNLSDTRSRIRDGILSLAFGGLITLICLAVLAEPVTRDVREYYAANAYKLAHGKNVVNVILVDFRGMDTMVEITVLAISAIGVYSLIKLQMKKT